jgi:hypothetical protein
MPLHGVAPGNVEGGELLAHRLPGDAESGDLKDLVVSRKLLAWASLKKSGTTTLSRVMSAFCTVRSEILFSIFVALKPSSVVSTRKALTLLSSTSRA